jgi:hypothetical protein
MKPSTSVAEALAGVWGWHRTPRFRDYVAESFGVRITDLAEFDRLYIYQVADGDIESGNFEHENFLQWWEVDDLGIRECGRPDCKLGWRDAPEKLRGSFYRWPHISFLHRGDAVGFGECYGPELLNRKVGQVLLVATGVAIADVRVVYPRLSGQ